MEKAWNNGFPFFVSDAVDVESSDCGWSVGRWLSYGARAAYVAGKERLFFYGCFLLMLAYFFSFKRYVWSRFVPLTNVLFWCNILGHLMTERVHSKPGREIRLAYNIWREDSLFGTNREWCGQIFDFTIHRSSSSAICAFCAERSKTNGEL